MTFGKLKSCGTMWNVMGKHGQMRKALNVGVHGVSSNISLACMRKGQKHSLSAASTCDTSRIMLLFCSFSLKRDKCWSSRRELEHF